SDERVEDAIINPTSRGRYILPDASEGNGNKSEFCTLLRKVLLHGPVRLVQEVIPELGVLPLDNAANLNVGECESLCADADAMPFDDGGIKRFAGERRDRPIGSDCARSQVTDAVVGCVIRDLHVRVALTFFREYLDAHIDVVVPSVVVRSL